MQAVVIGGGFAGLAAALALQDGRHQVTLLERRGVLGGRASSYRDAVSGDDVGSGTHVLVESCNATRELLRRVGGEDLLVGQRDLGLGPEDAPRPDSSLVFLRCGFGEVFERLGRHFASRGGVIRRRARAEGVEIADGRIHGVRYAQRPEARDDIRRGKEATDEHVVADVVVLAVPWHAVTPLLPEGLRSQPPFAGLDRLQPVPMVSIEVWLDRPVVNRILVMLRDPDAEFVIDKGRLHGREGPPQHLAIAAGPLTGSTRRSNAEQGAAVERALRRLLPGMAGAEVTRSLVLREPEGSFLPVPEFEGRPGPVTPVHGLFLAGDWTERGSPAAIEGAVRSGFRAARSLAERREGE